MKRRIYVNIMFKPKIWGLYFTSLFTVLGGFVIGIMIVSLLADMLLAFFFNLLLFGGLFVFFFIRDNRDEVEYRAKKHPWLKKRITPYSLSLQNVRILD
jgi:hypothetical protein